MKNLAFYSSFLILFSLLTSCEKEEAPVEDSIWQVYVEKGTEKYEGSLYLTGEPYIPLALLEGGNLPGTPHPPINMPWTIQAFVKNGILSIDFTRRLTLNDEYSSEHTGGKQIAHPKLYYIKDLADRWFLYELVLLKRESVSSYSEINMYFADNDYTYNTNDGKKIQFKAGWNFCNHDNGTISQDINDILNQGFRWHWLFRLEFNI